MIGAVVVTLLWAAAVYRIVLSLRSIRTVWRTAFTVTSVSVALGATFQIYGEVLDEHLQIWNLSVLLTPLALIITAAATSTYVATLRKFTVPARSVAARIVIGSSLWAVEITTWLLAPLHQRQLTNFSGAWPSGWLCVFNLTFAAAIVFAATETAVFCLTRAASKTDLTRTISLALTGTACLSGATAFALGGVAVVARYTTGSDLPVLTTIFNTAIPPIMVVLALGTLTLLAGPPAIDLVRHYQRWRALRPLWRDLINGQPGVHLDVSATGGPRQRARLRVQRATVEIYDALRLTRVHVGRGASVDELARALHSPGAGQFIAADVLGSTETIDAQLLALARSYSRSPT